MRSMTSTCVRSKDAWAMKGPSPEKLREIYAQQPTLLPTMQDVQNRADKYLGPAYQPQTDAGQIGYNVGERLPGIPIFGGLFGRIPR